MATRNSPMERKVQLTGGSTYTVSLPKEWATQQEITAGSTVRLYMTDNHVLIAPGEQSETDLSATIDVLNSPDFIARQITAAYTAGASQIMIDNVTDQEIRQVTSAITNGLIGLEPQPAADTTVRLKTMLDIDQLSADQALAQMQSTALSMHNGALDALLSQDREQARRVIDQDDDVDRLFRLIAREFHSSLGDVGVHSPDDRLSMFDYYTTARQLERIGDHAAKIAGVVNQGINSPPAELTTEITELGELSRNCIRQATNKLLEGNSVGELRSVIATIAEVQDRGSALDQHLYETDISDAYRLGTVVDSIVRTAAYGGNIAEAGLRVAIQTQGR